jgi:hypothetical protein
VIVAPGSGPALTASSDDYDDDDNDDGCSASRRTSTASGGMPVPHPSTSRFRSLTINVTPDLYAYLRQLAAKETTSVSHLLRQLVAQSRQTQRQERNDHAR